MVNQFGMTSYDLESGRIFALEGELDASTCPGLSEQLVGPPCSLVVVDLALLTFIDSSGLGAIHAARRRAIGTGEPSSFVAPARWSTGSWRSRASTPGWRSGSQIGPAFRLRDVERAYGNPSVRLAGTGAQPRLEVHSAHTDLTRLISTPEIGPLSSRERPDMTHDRESRTHGDPGTASCDTTLWGIGLMERRMEAPCRMAGCCVESSH